jgi:hypothetical protein
MKSLCNILLNTRINLAKWFARVGSDMWIKILLECKDMNFDRWKILMYFYMFLTFILSSKNNSLRMNDYFFIIKTRKRKKMLTLHRVKRKLTSRWQYIYLCNGKKYHLLKPSRQMSDWYLSQQLFKHCFPFFF